MAAGAQGAGVVRWPGAVLSKHYAGASDMIFRANVPVTGTGIGVSACSSEIATKEFRQAAMTPQPGVGSTGVAAGGCHAVDPSDLVPAGSFARVYVVASPCRHAN